MRVAKRHLYILLIITFAFAACRHKKELVQITTINKPAATNSSALTADVSSKDSVKTLALSDSISKPVVYRFIVSFYSIGEGPDYKAHQEFVDFIKNYQLRKNVTIAIDEVPWGREGEVDCCMKLTELTAAEQVDFITSLKAALADARWVHYSENTPCRNKRR
jgi:hypothetical protein